MTIDPALRYEGISPKAYEHPADRAATAALRSIPLMDQLVRRLCDFGHERRFRQVLLGNAVHSARTRFRTCGPATRIAFGSSTSSALRTSMSPRRRSSMP